MARSRGEKARAYDEKYNKTEARKASWREYRRAHAKENLEHVKQSQRRKRLRIFVRDEFRCVYCREVLDYDQLTVDHKYPLSRGGDDTDANKITACGVCNRKKSTRSYTEYMAMLHPDRVPDWVTE